MRLGRKATAHLLRVEGHQTYMVPSMEKVNYEVRNRDGAPIVDIHNTDPFGPALGPASSFYVYFDAGHTRVSRLSTLEHIIKEAQLVT